MLQSTSSLQFVSAHLEGGGSGCVSLVQHSLLKKELEDLALASALRSCPQKELQDFILRALLVLKVASGGAEDGEWWLCLLKLKFPSGLQT